MAVCGVSSGVTSGASLYLNDNDSYLHSLNENENRYPYGGKSNSILPYIPIQIFVSFNIVGM